MIQNQERQKHNNNRSKNNDKVHQCHTEAEEKIKTEKVDEIIMVVMVAAVEE